MAVIFILNFFKFFKFDFDQKRQKKTRKQVEGNRLRGSKYFVGLSEKGVFPLHNQVFDSYVRDAALDDYDFKAHLSWVARITSFTYFKN